MGFLDLAPKTLGHLLGGRVSDLSEIDLDDGGFVPIVGQVIQALGLGSLEVGRVMLSPRTTVALFRLPPDGGADRQVMAETLSLLYQRNWTAQLMQVALKPLNPDMTSDDFYDEIASRVLEGMMARYVIIRQIVHDSETRYLRCVTVRDRRGALEVDWPELYDVERGSPAAPLYLAAEERFREEARHLRIVHRSDEPDVFETMAGMSGTAGIQTIIIAALTLGDRIRGFINVGFDVPLHPNDYMAATFATSFNQMSVAIENHETLNQVAGLRHAEMDEFLHRSNVQFIQGFRHLAQTALVEADDAHRRMLKGYTWKGSRDDDPSRKLSGAHKEIESAFSRMAALRNLDRKMEKSSLTRAFEEALELVRYQASRVGADVRVHLLSPGPIEARVNVEGMHHAFGNLLLNSFEAFEGANTKRSDRRVNVQFRKERGAVTIEFGDDGPGIRTGRNVRSAEDIWLPDRTTKQKGTGYGLPFVRMIVQDWHRGSINLRESRRGALFRITIPDGLTDD